MCFRSLRQTSRVALVISLLAVVGVVAYAASVLFNTAHNTTSLSKGRYIEVSLSGASASGSVRPGSTVALSPVLTPQENNNNATTIMKVTVPTVNGVSAYDYEVSSGWTEIESDPTAGVYVYGYSSNSEMTVFDSGDSTDPFADSFTMKGSITGAELNAMGEINNPVDGIFLEADAGTDHGTVWGMVQ